MKPVLDRGAILKPAPPGRVEVRGPDSKHLYGYLDPARLTLEVKRKGGQIEVIDLQALLLEVKMAGGNL